MRGRETSITDINLLALTGTSGSGKSTLAERLIAEGLGFRLVEAITTREPRADDRCGQYRYLSDAEFVRLAMEDAFLIETTYRNYQYGIAFSDLESVVSLGVVPLLVLTPASCAGLLRREGTRGRYRALCLFVDAPDSILDERLLSRDGRLRDDRDAVRLQDRTWVRLFTVIQNINLELSIGDILRLWRQFANN